MEYALAGRGGVSYDCVIKGEKNLPTDLLGSSRLEGVTGPY